LVQKTWYSEPNQKKQGMVWQTLPGIEAGHKRKQATVAFGDRKVSAEWAASLGKALQPAKSRAENHHLHDI